MITSLKNLLIEKGQLVIFKRFLMITIFTEASVVVRDALETVVEAQGGVSELAKRADMDPQVLSKMLSNKETPLIDALGTVLKALDYQLSIAPLQNESLNAEFATPSLEVQDGIL